MTEKNKKYKAPRMGDKTGYIPTKATMAATYDERVLEEMKETLEKRIEEMHKIVNKY